MSGTISPVFGASPQQQEEEKLLYSPSQGKEEDAGLISDRDAYVISDQPSPSETPVLKATEAATIIDAEEEEEEGEENDDRSEKRPPKGFILEFDASDFKKPLRKKKMMKKKLTAAMDSPSASPSTPPTSAHGKKKRPSLTGIEAAQGITTSSANSLQEGAPDEVSSKLPAKSKKAADELAMEVAAQRLVDRQRGISTPSSASNLESADATTAAATGLNRRRDYQRIEADHDPSWVYQPPPNNQRTLLFAEDWPPPSWAIAGGRSGTSATQRSATEDQHFPLVYDNKFIVLGFSSDFDSGNLIQVERTAPYTYNLHCCPDCGNSPFQTNNKQWFHFSVRGLPKGTCLKITMVGVANSKMYTFGWVPVSATVPLTPEAKTSILRAHEATNSTVSAMLEAASDGSPTLRHHRLLAASSTDPAAAMLTKARNGQAPFSEDTYMSALAAGEVPILYARMSVRDAKAVVTQTNELTVIPGYPGLAYKPVVNKFTAASPGASPIPAPDAATASAPPLMRQVDPSDVTGEGGSIYFNEKFDSATTKIADHISKSRGVTIVPKSPDSLAESPVMAQSVSISAERGPVDGATMATDSDKSPLVAVDDADREQLASTNLLSQKSSLVIGDRVACPAAKNTERLQPNAMPAAAEDGGADEDGNESETLNAEGNAEDDEEQATGGGTAASSGGRVRSNAKASKADKEKNPSAYNISFDVASEIDIPFAPTTETERCALAMVIRRYYTPAPSSPTGSAPPLQSVVAATIAAAKARPISPYPQGHPKCPALYVAGNHPYSFGRMCRHMLQWRSGLLKFNDELALSGDMAAEEEGQAPTAQEETPSSTSRPSTPPPTAPPIVLCPTTGKSLPVGGIYYNEEVLCISPDGHDVHLLTITGIGARTKVGPREDAIAEIHSPLAGTSASMPVRGSRPLTFPYKKYIVISARIHPGETPASYMMHGALDFIFHPTDPRAKRLRRDCVIVVVPIINPDGTYRGHSRADTTGQNLNRCYRDPSFTKHPSPFAVKNLLLYLQQRGRLHLYVDLHAHANKKGTFAYGNSMESVSMVQNMLYAKLVAMNSPYFEFPSCNFSENNMFAVGKTGEGKDCSSRVTIYQDTGFVHSYTVEANYVAASSINAVIGLPNLDSSTHTTTYTTGQLFVPPSAFVSAAASALSPAAAQVAAYLGTQPTSSAAVSAGVFVIGSNTPIPEQVEVPPTGAAVPTRYSPSTHADVGKGLLLGFMDLHGMQPDGFSRVQKSTFRTTKAVGQAISKYLMIDVVEAMRRQVMYRCGISHKEFFGALKASSGGARTPSVGKLSLLPSDLPTTYTAKGSRTFPPTTIYSLGNVAVKYAANTSGDSSSADTVLWTTFASPSGGEQLLPHGFVSDISSQPPTAQAVSSAAPLSGLGRKTSTSSLTAGLGSRAPSGSSFASTKSGPPAPVAIAGRRKSTSAPTSSSPNTDSVCIVGTALPKPTPTTIPTSTTSKGRAAPLPKASSRSPSAGANAKKVQPGDLLASSANIPPTIAPTNEEGAEKPSSADGAKRKKATTKATTEKASEATAKTKKK